MLGEPKHHFPSVNWEKIIVLKELPEEFKDKR
jgi:hypothetical protein